MIEKFEQIRDWAENRQKTLASLGICLLAVLMASHVFSGNNGIKAYFQKKAENRELKKEIDQLKTENSQLTNRVNSLKTDPQTIEKVAREELKYTRPGEVVFVSPDQQSQQSQPPANATAQKR